MSADRDGGPAGHDAAPEPDPLWYKDAVVYQLHVKAFGDSNGDGYGDFKGLTERLDYVQSLGVNTLWLLPFYPSPLRDDGYDIADYLDVHPDYGTLDMAATFIQEAHRRGLRVITELVINHTSDQHPWFQRARRAPRNSPERAFYVWSDDDRKFPETRIIFTDTEASNWAWDPVAKQYYWHRFFSHQPDLNHNNPAVVDAVIDLMRFWLDLGVDGLRLDAIPYLCVREGTNNENLPETHAVIKRMRAVVDAEYSGKLFLAEANQWPEDVRDYFGDGDECHMAYHFPLMPRMYMALAEEDRHPIVEIMQQTPDIPDNCQWAIFLRNHDELTLEMVTDAERDYMYRTYASDPRMRVNVGIRRRLAPLMDNEIDKIKLMNSLLLSMPGSPVLYYGDEIGMGDNIYLGDRNGVRTPMQWSPDRNAGFSRADPQKLYLPPIMDPVYGYAGVNVEAQDRAPSSLLNWMRRLLAVRRSTRVFGRGRLRFLKPGNRKILAYLREYDGETVLCVANLGRGAQPVELELGEFKDRVPVELLGNTPFPPVGELPYLLTLPGHGFYWFRLTADAPVPVWHQDRLAPELPPLLVLFAGFDSFFPERCEPGRREFASAQLARLERDVLPRYLSQQRWYAGKGQRPSCRLAGKTLWQAGGAVWLLLWIDVQGARQRYFLPLAYAAEADVDAGHVGSATLARARRQAQLGVLYDAFYDERFCQALLGVLADGRDVDWGELVLRPQTTAAFAALAGEAPARLPVQRPTALGSNTAIRVGPLFAKAYRRLQPGLNPEVEIGAYLTERGYGNAAALAAALTLHGGADDDDRDDDGTLLLTLQAYRDNQGDGWQYTQDYLHRLFDEDGAAGGDDERYRYFADTLGRRLGELHALLAAGDGAAFAPQPFDAAAAERWRRGVLDEIDAAYARLAPRELGELGERLRAARAALERRVRDAPVGDDALLTRYHGDFHLGQVLIDEYDVLIIDFEGEPARPPAERRRRHTPLKDVAGLLRSFDYARCFAARHGLPPLPDGSAERRLRAWQRAAETAFLDAYRAAVGALWPRDGDALLSALQIEKACYELRYELDNRPDWVDVPAAGLLALAEPEQ